MSSEQWVAGGRHLLLQVAAVHAHHALDGHPCPLPLLVVLDVDVRRGGQQSVSQRREIIAQTDEVAHHQQLVCLLLPLVGAHLRHRGPGQAQAREQREFVLFVLAGSAGPTVRADSRRTRR